MTTKTKNISPNWTGICAGPISAVEGRWLHNGKRRSTFEGSDLLLFCRFSEALEEERANLLE